MNVGLSLPTPEGLNINRKQMQPSPQPVTDVFEKRFFS
jgi:hypothetical protein